MTANVININAATPFLINVPNSQVSPVWIRFLSSIVTVIQNTSSGINLDDFTTLLLTSRSIVDPSENDELRATQATLRQQIAANVALASRVDALESMAAGRTTASIALRAIVTDSTSRSVASNSSLISDDTSTNATMYLNWSATAAGDNALKVSSTELTFNPSTGLLTSKQLVATTGFACNGKTAQTAYASGGFVVTTGSTNVAPYGFTTAAQADDIVTKLNNVITALENNGTMS